MSNHPVVTDGDGLPDPINKPRVEIEELGEEGSKVSRMRKYKGAMKILVTLIAVSLSLFHVYTGVFGSLYLMFQRSIHLGLASLLVFILYPFSGKTEKDGPLGMLINSICIVGSLCVYAYPIIDYEGQVQRQAMPNTLDLVFGGMAILLVLEACRRVIGLSITLVAIGALMYAYFGNFIPGPLGHRPFDLDRILYTQYMSTEGIFGIPLGVSSTFVFMFILFGAFIMRGGMGKFLSDVAMSLAGGAAGGPAKVAVIASGFEGMMSGSSVANVVTSGSVTIPLMKSIGYPAHFAGAVEATASTGGMFMPPVMGAGGFIMAEWLGIPYTKIILYAFIPAWLYYLACYCQIHYRAKKMNMRGLPRAELPAFWPLIKKDSYLLIPFGVLIVLLLMSYSPMRVATVALGVSIVVSFFQKGEGRFSLRNLIENLEAGAKTALAVAVACACAGIVVGVITMTGLGMKMSSYIVDLSGGILIITMVLTAIVCLIMGMGVPVTASYIIVASMAAPALEKLGVLPIAAHLFVFYFAVIADITPPVCIASYAAAGLAGADPMKTGFTATKLGIAAFIVPFMFCYSPSLMGIGSPLEVVWSTITAAIGIWALGAGVEIYFVRKSTIIETLLLIVAALCLIKPGIYTDILGFCLLLSVYLVQTVTHIRDVPVALVHLLLQIFRFFIKKGSSST